MDYLALHELLVARQPMVELARKQRKASRGGIFTQEDIDWAKRRGLIMHRQLWRSEPNQKLPR